MLPLQPKNLHSKQISLWAKIAGISCMAHAVFGIWLLLIEHQLLRNTHVVMYLGEDGKGPQVFVESSGGFSRSRVVESKELNAPLLEPTTLITDAIRERVVDEVGDDVTNTQEVADGCSECEGDGEQYGGAVMAVVSPEGLSSDVASTDVLDEASAIIDGESALQVGDALYLQLRDAITKHWAPPLGVSSDVSCDVRVVIDEHGIIEELEVCRPSGVLVYDIVARRALSQASLPRWAWGRALTIAFKQ